MKKKEICFLLLMMFITGMGMTQDKAFFSDDGEDMGRMFREFSDQKGVPVKSVVAGGCEGSDAARAMHDGFFSSTPMKGAKEEDQFSF